MLFDKVVDRFVTWLELDGFQALDFRSHGGLLSFHLSQALVGN